MGVVLLALWGAAKIVRSTKEGGKRGMIIIMGYLHLDPSNMDDPTHGGPWKADLMISFPSDAV